MHKSKIQQFCYKTATNIPATHLFKRKTDSRDHLWLRKGANFLQGSRGNLLTIFSTYLTVKYEYI